MVRVRQWTTNSSTTWKVLSYAWIKSIQTKTLHTSCVLIHITFIFCAPSSIVVYRVDVEMHFVIILGPSENQLVIAMFCKNLINETTHTNEHLREHLTLQIDLSRLLFNLKKGRKV